MKTQPVLAALIALVLAAPTAGAVDLGKVDRTIKKEPAYKTRPAYCLLAFGPDAKDRVWLVLDGDVLYVDRNGNGDLTDAGEKVAAKAGSDRDPDERIYQFEVGELRVGGRVHKGLSVSAAPISRYGNSVKGLPNARAAVAADPKARLYGISLDVDKPGLKGAGLGGRVSQLAGIMDGNGALLFAKKPADAPVVHFGGPLQVTFYGGKPALRLGRDNDLVLVVGTPGHGPGTFAMLGYEETIPEKVFPRADILFPAARQGAPPFRERFELKQRC